MIEWLAWNLWQRWAWKWQHRNDTPAQMMAELRSRFDAYIDDMPATKEVHQANDAIEELARVLARDSK